MHHLFWVATAAALVLSEATATAAPPKLAANDVTWLWPPPATSEELKEVISIDALKATDGESVWSDGQFDDLTKVADSDHASVGENRIGLPDSVRSKSVWKIAAFRVDPTAPGGHEVIRKDFGERPQIRLILQPVTSDDGEIKVHDIAVHLVYSYLKDDSAENPDRDRFRKIVADLDKLKQHVKDAGVETSGEPLGVHPGLKAAVPGLRVEVEKFLSRHLHPKDVNAMAIMGLDDPEPWIFVALGKSPNSEHFGPIPFLPAQMISFRSRTGVVSPPPMVNNLNPIPSRLTMPDKESDRRGVATAALFTRTSLDLSKLATVGKDEDGKAVADDKIRNRDIPDLVADPLRSHFFNTDCVSCHTETRRRIRLNLAPGDFAFRQDGQPPAIDPEVLPKDDWNVRNLGWFPPHPFIGRGPTVATVTQRTANETAEVVDFIERQYRHDPTPGPDTTGGQNESAAVDVDPAQPSAKQVTYLDQGWSADDRLDFYFVGQGSQLLPYSWFLALELPRSDELLRSDRHLASLGFIPYAVDERRNPDGLPIGFVKDSNPSTIAQKAGFLGKGFNREHYPGDDWLGFTCAACHTADLTYKGTTIRLDGGAALADVEQFLAATAASMRATVDSEEKFHRFQQRIEENAEGDVDTAGLKDELASYTEVIENLVTRNKADHPYGLGRLDAFGAILNQICDAALGVPENRRPSNAPVSYPFLWDTPHLDWVQWNSSVDVPVSRNVGEVLGVFAHAQLVDTPADTQFDTSARVELLHRLETQLRKLQAPAWPEAVFGTIDRDKAEAGRKLFADNCAACHSTRDENGKFEMTAPNEFGAQFIKTTSVPFAEIGTDPQMVVNFITRTGKPGALESSIKHDMESAEGAALQRIVNQLRRARGMGEADFSKEAPAGTLLRAAVRGVIAESLSDEIENLSEDEKKQVMLELRGGRVVAGTPPNGGTGYKARPLNGVWATAPYGHAGAVPNLYQWLLPEDDRVDEFFIGSHEFDPKQVGLTTEKVEGAFHFRTVTEDGTPIPGNSNQGHSGPRHTDFSEEERWQIIEYIKTLK